MTVLKEELNIVKPSDDFTINDFQTDMTRFDLFDSTTLESDSFNTDNFKAEETGDVTETNVRIEIQISHPDIINRSYSEDIKVIIKNNINTYETLDSGLVLHYPLTEFDENISLDESSNSFNGEVNDVDIANEVAAYSGSGSYIDVPTETHDEISNSFSISMWIKTDSPSTFYSEIDNTDSFLLFRRTDDYPDFRIATNDERLGLDYNDEILTDEWTHVVGTYHADNGLKLYVNNKLDGENTDTIGDLNYGIQDISVGRDSRGGSGHRAFSGKMANLQIYDFELSSSDIDYLYEDGVEKIIN